MSGIVAVFFVYMIFNSPFAFLCGVSLGIGSMLYLICRGYTNFISTLAVSVPTIDLSEVLTKAKLLFPLLELIAMLRSGRPQPDESRLRTASAPELRVVPNERHDVTEPYVIRPHSPREVQPQGKAVEPVPQTVDVLKEPEVSVDRVGGGGASTNGIVYTL
jgi:hypothetical protein